MKREKELEPEGPVRGGWMLTFSDMTTLLLTFFVLIIATSSLKNEKVMEMLESFRAVGATPIKWGHSHTRRQIGYDPLSQLPVPWFDRHAPETFSEIARAVHELELDGISLTFDERGTVMRLDSSLLFRSGTAIITDNEAIELLRNISDILNQSSEMIIIEGHTDDIPISTAEFPSNWELSVKRATFIVNRFIEFGVSPYRLTAAGYGEYKPISSNENAEGRALNRRVEIIVERHDEHIDHLIN